MNIPANSWCLGLPGQEVCDSPRSWNIQIGQIIETSHLEFHPSELQLNLAKQKSAVSAGQNDFYEVNAEIVFLSTEVCVVDFGLQAVCKADSELPVDARVGDYIAGEIYLSMAPSIVAPAELKDSLRNRWKVNRIRADHTPPSEAVAESGPYSWYDHTNPKYWEVTQVVPAIGAGVIGYLLDCTLIESNKR